MYNQREQVAKEYEEKVIEIKRVSKKNSGGSQLSFTAVVVVGNKSGKIGEGTGKAKDVPASIAKAISNAKKNVISVKIKNDTISHTVSCKYASAKVILMPAPKGSGVIAGGTVRSVLELAGVKNVSAKMYGSNNKLANIRCALGALKMLKG
jgi:small subunit ribosomal protein S5